MNEYRRKKKLPPMTMNTVMSAEALKHSENMAARRTSFGHNGFQHRIKRITPALNGVSGAAENVAMGSTTAKEVVSRWLKSPVHKQNIEGRYNHTGIGVAADRKGVLYFTQIFAAN
ncbi:CAP domain-containing protein [Niastella caeni]|uniref:CAP domain-containing protein n=1 Tax=Niastella caeni TaxID=2569763 RepID=A0A4S8HTQ2_9BACT|nr:CAP domain-containing protein [Niastella caeni]